MTRKTTPVKIGIKGATLMKVRVSWVKRTRRPPIMRPRIPRENKMSMILRYRKNKSIL